MCANVANLLLARAVSRQKEFGIRLALGARRGRLAAQLLTETLLLAGAGALVGRDAGDVDGAVAPACFRPPDIPLDFGGGLNLPTLGFTLLIAWSRRWSRARRRRCSRRAADLNETLKEGGRGGGSGTHSHRLRGLLVVAEVALAMVALIGAGLFFRSFQNASGIQPGFDMTNVSVSQFYLSYAGYSGRGAAAFCRTLRERHGGEAGRARR